MAHEQIKSIFLDSMEDLGLHDMGAMDEKGDILDGLKIFAMANESLWLPRFTLRANELSQLLFKGPCFDVTFKYDIKNASGFSIEDPNEAIKLEYGYPMFESHASNALKKRIAKLSVKQCISIKGDHVMLNENIGMYEFKDGDKYLRPLDPDSGLIVSIWMSKMPDLNRAYENTMSLDINDGMSL
jgi:hypothetical protein